MKSAIVYLFDSNKEVQYGLNWGQRENRDPNQAYLQLTSEIYKGDFFPVKGKFFIVNTDDGETFIFNRAQKEYGCALQTPENNSIIGQYLRKRLGVKDGAPITKDAILAYGRDNIVFSKIDDLHYTLDFTNESNSIATMSSDFSPRQIIFYGAPGTGKSHKIKEKFELENVPKENIFRTTFHPDSDYSTFVGAYKPSRSQKPVYGLFGDKTIRLNDGGDLSEEVITYKFTPQAFLKAYIRAYQVPTENVYLVIEEINRGNCAQIFGDLFQLLDRDPSGKSDYTIKADDDMRTFLEDEFIRLGVGDDGIKDGELCLPPNLYIYATMNTSDQSLFPIDSAFKRRWDWEYEPIKYKNTGWTIKIDDDHQYKWVEFQNEVNFRILRDTGSEDKMLGDYFVNPVDGIITKSMLLNKILFYLWNDVCKDGDGEIFKTNGSTEVTFSELFGNDAKLIAMLDYLQSEYKKRKPSKEETPTATDVEAEQEPLD